MPNRFDHVEHLVQYDGVEYYHYRFPNGFGAMVHAHQNALKRGLWKVCLVDKRNNPVTDVLGDEFVFEGCSHAEVLELLDMIKAIPRTWGNHREKIIKKKLVEYFSEA